MACDRFADALKAHALGAPLRADAAAHLAICSACQARLDVEERLLATIGQALDDVASVMPAPDFVSRVRVHVESAPRWTPGAWLTPAIVAVATVLVAIVVAGRLLQDDSAVQHVMAPQPVTRSADTRVETRPPARAMAPSRTTTKPRAPRQAVAVSARAAQTPEVLVPIEQRRAVGRLFESLRAGRPEVVSALMNLHGGASVIQANELTIAPIRIDPVVVSTLPPSAPIVDK